MLFIFRYDTTCTSISSLFQAYDYKGDNGSVDSNGSVTISHVSSNPDPNFYGGAFDNDAYETTSSQVSGDKTTIYKI